MFPQLLRCPCPFPLPNSCSGLRQTLSFSTKIFLHHLMQCPNGFIQPSFPLTSSYTPHQNIPTGMTFLCWQNYVYLSLNSAIFFPILLFPSESTWRYRDMGRWDITDPAWAPQSLMKGAAKSLPSHLINHSCLEIQSFFHKSCDYSFPHQFSKFPSVSSPRVNMALSYTNFSRRQTKK